MAALIKIVHGFVILCLLQRCTGFIQKLNESQYASMPPLNELDPWDTCAARPGWLYCLVDYSLVSDQPSTLLDMIHEYSETTIHRYNHSQIHRGICVTDTCKDLLMEYTFNDTLDLNGTLVACQNRTIWRDYELQVNLEEVRYCKSSDDKKGLDASDVTMLIVYFIIIALNSIGTIYDECICKGKKGNQYLLAFSLARNWAKLTASADIVSDPRLLSFKIFHGLRSFLMMLVLFSHIALLATSFYVDNPQYFEAEDVVKLVLFGGSLVVHTFFLMSGLFVSYNFQRHAEKSRITWLDLPRGLLLRWLRLTPLYAFVLGSVATLMRHVGSGPIWDLVVTNESNECRKYWWSHLLYINNYIRDNTCLQQCWYVTCDMQMFVVGMIICLIARTPRLQKIVLAIFMAVSVIIVGAQTYILNLDAVVIHRTEKFQDIFKTDDTFRLMFIRGHTNMSVYIMGLSAGFLIYYWQQKNIDFSKYKRFGGFFLAAVPVLILVIYSTSFFTQERPLILKAVYAALHKVVFQLFVAITVLAMIFKVETIQAGFLQWRGFTWTARVTFTAYLLHTIVQRAMVGIIRHPLYLSDYGVLMMWFSSIFLTFFLSAVLYLILENPIATVVKIAMTPSTPPKSLKEVPQDTTATQNV